MAEVKDAVAVLQSEVNENSVQIFVRALPEGSKINAQIGTMPVQSINIMDEVEMHTLILLDNSLSITEENRHKIQEILKIFFMQKPEGEKISLAVFGEEISFLAEDETESEVLIQALENIEYKNQDSFLTDILYKELQSLKENSGYVRLIIATDGVDNWTIGYTREELQDELKEYGYPVYSLGSLYKENDKELENLFAISRMTKGKYYLLDDYLEYDEIVAGLNDSVTGIEIQVPPEYCDGSEKNLLLSIETEPENVELKKQVTMPFFIQEQETIEQEMQQEIEQEIVNVEIVEEDNENEVMIETAVTVEETPLTNVFWIAGAVVFLAVVVAVVIVVTLKLKRQNKKNGNQTLEPRNLDWSNPKEFRTDVTDIEQGTVYLESEEGTMCLEEEEQTVSLFQNPTQYILLLKDKNNPFKEFRYTLNESVVLGRLGRKGADIVLDYEPTVSARHCKISVENGAFFVEDLNSSNKTYLNEILVEDKMTLISGSTLKLGKLELIVEIL